MAKGDEKVLSLIDDSTNLYQDTAALKNQQPAGEFSKLEIGETDRRAANTTCG